MMRDAQLGGVTRAKAEAWARAHNSSVAKGFETLGQALRLETELRKDDPYEHGYEPPIWYVASALLRNSPVTERMRAEVKRRTGFDWDTFAEAMRKACGFEQPVNELLIMGANRSGKTDWAAKRMVRRLCSEPELQLSVGAQTVATSRRTQQDRVYHYLPKELKAKNGVRESVLYLNYKLQTGFSFNKLTLGNRSALGFVTYEQDVNAIMEGPAYDEGWLDEEFGKEWLDALKFRLASKRGTLIATFTPVSGYTPVVADFLEGMIVTRHTTAYMLPKDGGPPLPGAQLGLSEEEYAELARSTAEGTDCVIPESRPENCFEWIQTEPFSEPENVAPGRVFEKVPRVARKRDGSAAILWFLGRDNPYGSPGRVIDVAMGNIKAEETIRRRVYGMARKTRGGRFPAFDPARHTVPDVAVPQLLARTFVCDPAPERNWFFLWIGVDERGDVYVYREWPGNYEIPTQGFPGPWAEISSRKGGVNDGDRGSGQEKFGFSLEKYKAIWAHVEGWADASGWCANGCPGDFPPSVEIQSWHPGNGTREPLRRRVIDSRASSQSKITMGEDRTLFEFCQELDDNFVQASGRRIGAGEELINQLLSPAPGGRRLLIAKSCKNTIFALANYTGADGQKGACKEPLDCLRYGLESGMLDDRPSHDIDGPTTTGTQRKPSRFLELNYLDD